MNFLCKYCESSFVSRNKLFIHLKNEHDSSGGNLVKKLFKDSLKNEILNTTDSTIINDASLGTISHSQRDIESEIETISEDEWYRVVLKPQGLATMGVKGPTLLTSNRLLLPNAISLQLRYKKAVPCHRLDSSTGGLVVCSKSKAAEVNLMKSFRSKFIKKTYLAIVAGKLEPSAGVIDKKVGDKDARTLYEVVTYTRSAQYGWLSTVKLWPVTGRRHQLRRHMAELNHSIIGDRRYSFASSWPVGFDQQFLWSVSVAFPHPRTFGVLEAMSRCSSRVSEDIVAAIECPQEDIDFDAILRPYYDTTAHGLSELKGESCCDATTATIVETVIVKIAEPKYYEDLRAIHEREFVDVASTSNSIS